MFTFTKYSSQVLKKIFPFRMCNKDMHPLSGKHLKVSSFSSPPFLIINDDYSKLLGGVALDTFNTLADHFNFHWQPKIVVDWAIFYPNGSIEGALGELLKGNVDLSLEQPIMAYGQFATWTHYPYAHDFIFIEPPPKLRPRAMNILHPLDLHSWLGIVTSIIAISLSLYMLDKIEDKKLVTL